MDSALQDEIKWRYPRPLEHLYTYPLENTSRNVSFPVMHQRENGIYFSGFRRSDNTTALDLNWSISGRAWKWLQTTLITPAKLRAKIMQIARWEHQLAGDEYDDDFAAFYKFMETDPPRELLNHMYMSLMNWRCLRSRAQCEENHREDIYRRRPDLDDEEIETTSWFPVMVEMSDKSVVTVPFVAGRTDPDSDEQLVVVKGSLSDRVIVVQRCSPEGFRHGPRMHMFPGQLQVDAFQLGCAHVEYTVTDLLAKKIGSAIQGPDDSAIVSVSLESLDLNTLESKECNHYLSRALLQGEQTLQELTRCFEASLIMWGVMAITGEQISSGMFQLNDVDFDDGGDERSDNDDDEDERGEEDEQSDDDSDFELDEEFDIRGMIGAVLRSARRLS